MHKQISWHAREFVYYEKGFMWYAIVTIGAVLALIYSVWVKEPLMFVTLLISYFLWVFYARRQPQQTLITLSGKGVTIGRDVYPFSNLRMFWILYEPPTVKTLNFETTNYLNHDISIQLENQDPNEIRELLLQYLPEDPHREEAYHEKLFRKLKF